MSTPQFILTEFVSLAPLTSWRIGGVARYLATVRSAHGVAEAIAFADAHFLPVWILGGGSNMLISDDGLPGLVIRMRDMTVDIQHRSGVAAVRIGAGAPMAGTVRQLISAGWAGLSWAEGLPGTVGGAVYGNAGCYGGAMADSVTDVELWRGGNITSVGPHELGFSYRSSALKRHVVPKLIHGMHVGDIEPIVVGATIQLTQEDPQLLATQLAETAALRKSKTPQGSSCGSVFKNPPGDSAGRLIEAAGLKGASVGAACVADKHANYIINRGGATSADVCTLVAHIRATVQAQFAVTLEPEVQILGAEWPFNA